MSRPALGPWLLPAAVVGPVLFHCVVASRAHLFWADELLTWYPVTAPFRTMLASTADTINAAPPLYFVLTWGWVRVFGDSALALRLFSACALGGAILLMFSVLRRTYEVRKRVRLRMLMSAWPTHTDAVPTIS